MPFTIKRTAFSPRTLYRGVYAKLAGVRLVDRNGNNVGRSVATNEAAIKRLVRRYEKSRGPLAAWATGVTFSRRRGKNRHSDAEIWTEIRMENGVLNVEDIEQILRTTKFVPPEQRR